MANTPNKDDYQDNKENKNDSKIDNKGENTAKNKPITGDDKLDQALEVLKQSSSEKKAQLKEYVADIFGNLKNTENVAADKLKSVVVKIDDHLHAKPWLYVAGAVVSGWLIGSCCRRKK